MLQALRAKCFVAAQEGKFASCPFLRMAGGVWAAAVWAKNRLYERGWLSPVKLPAVVVSVGSVVAGGGGKTPLVLLLAKALSPCVRVAILSRGYASGDEAALLNRRLGEDLVYVGRDRIATGRRAIQEKKAQVLLLDDGLQHRRLYRDFELIVVDGERPFGYGAYLPRGLLRDSPARLREADLLFINGKSSFEGVEMRPEIAAIRDLQRRPWEKLCGVKIGAFCGLAYPKRFFDTLEQEGAVLVDRWILADHAKPDPDRLHAFAERCRHRGASLLVCSEKDAVKLDPTLSFSLPLRYAEMDLHIASGEPLLHNLIEKIILKSRLQNSGPWKKR